MKGSGQGMGRRSLANRWCVLKAIVCQPVAKGG